jgi:hypothetical protein
MMQQTKFSLLFLALISINVFAQTAGYHYRMELPDMRKGWNSIELPNHFYAKVKDDLSDIRIVGISEFNDTLEVPFLIEDNPETVQKKRVYCDIINKVRRGNKYFYTLENDTWKKINSLELDIDDDNFDWRVKLEGSNDQNRWYTILNSARILSITNSDVAYSYTTLNFSTSQYGFYRVTIENDYEPILNRAYFILKSRKSPELQYYEPTSVTIANEADHSTTVVDIELSEEVPVSRIELSVKDDFDYYRSIEIQKLEDSVQTPDGMRAYFTDLQENTFSSLEPGNFTFSYAFASHIQVVLKNHDNAPLNFDKVKVGGNKIYLMARVDQPGSFFLYYGNEKAFEPYYDIRMFENTIPGNLVKIKPVNEEILIKTTSETTKKNSINNTWLWITMVFIVIFIGGFTIKMIKETR